MGATQLLPVDRCRPTASIHTLGLQSPYDVFMKVSSYLPWINGTILANGGMASCDYFLSAPPKLGTHASVII